MKLGVFDSGIGGINVLKEIMVKYPDVEYLYYADTLHLPYGEKSKEQLFRFGTSIIRFFEKENVDMVIMACGTCSGFLDQFQKQTKLPIYDVITPTVEYVKRYSKVALLATSASIKNRSFQNQLELNGISVVPIACPNFVPYLEGLSEKELNMKEELKPLLNQKVDAVILGCTHYPLLKKEIFKLLHIPCIDMGICLTERLQIDDTSPFKLTIYASKVDDELKQNIEKILKIKTDVIEKNITE